LVAGIQLVEVIVAFVVNVWVEVVVVFPRMVVVGDVVIVRTYTVRVALMVVTGIVVVLVVVTVVVLVTVTGFVVVVLVVVVEVVVVGIVVVVRVVTVELNIVVVPFVAQTVTVVVFDGGKTAQTEAGAIEGRFATVTIEGMPITRSNTMTRTCSFPNLRTQLFCVCCCWLLRFCCWCTFRLVSL
jgi:hypothetical protein